MNKYQLNVTNLISKYFKREKVELTDGDEAYRILEMLNNLIAIDRLNKIQILQMVNLVSLSNDINDLKDNLKWESSKSYHQNTQNI